MTPKERTCCEKIALFFFDLITYIFLIPLILLYRLLKRIFTHLTKRRTPPTTSTNPSDQENKTASISIATNVIFNDGYTPYEEAMPCFRCQGINLTDLTSPSGYAHCKTYDELHSAAKGGCKLCTLLMLAIERSNGERNVTYWQAFRATVLAYEVRPTLMLVAREKGKWGGSESEKGLRSDLVDLRLEKMDGTVEGPRWEKRSELLAVVGLYADAGTLIFASAHYLNTEKDIDIDASQNRPHKHSYPAVESSAILQP
jgi:hypothetical protein